MKDGGFSVSAHVSAPAEAVYAVLADYREGHPRILPRPPFVSLDVEQGGVGTGTTIRVQMRVLGRTRTFRAVVTEPEPGRVLVETNDTGYVTTFTVAPATDGTATVVTIATEMPDRPGPLGALERWLVRRMLRPVYAEELRLLARVAAEPDGPPQPTPHIS